VKPLNRLLVAGTPFWGYIESVAKAFRENGLEVTSLVHEDFTTGVLGKLEHLGFPIQRLISLRFYNRLLKLARNVDTVLFWRGDLLSAEQLTTLKNSANVRLVMWLIDSVYSMRPSLSTYRVYDLVICYNQSEVEFLRGLKVNAIFLPLAYDPSLYFPIPGVAKDIDLYFVGNMHKSRMAQLESLLEAIYDRPWKIVIQGNVYSKFRFLINQEIRRQFPYLTRLVTDGPISHQKINVNSNRARVCLNLLPSQANSALNVRAFEICGSGGFQIVNRNMLLEQLFNISEELLVVDDLDQLPAMLDSCLNQNFNSEREKIAAAGLNRVRKEHTFEFRTDQIRQFIDCLECD
jgi:spore maturation protein CgeB